MMMMMMMMTLDHEQFKLRIDFVVITSSLVISELEALRAKIHTVCLTVSRPRPEAVTFSTARRG